MNSRSLIDSSRSRKTRVLVVEDEQDIADLIKHTLERGGDIEVEIVASGDAALKAAAESHRTCPARSEPARS